MTDLDSVAKTVIEISLNAKTGENVLIRGWDHTIDLMSRLAWQCERRNCNVLLSVQPEDLWLKSIMTSPLDLIENPSDPLIAALKESQAYVFTLGPRSPVPWKEIPERRHGAVSVWLDTRYDHSRFAAAWTRIAKKHKVRMLAIEATLATRERAEALGLNFEAWREVMYAGCSVNWKALSRSARRLTRILSGKEKVRLATPAGTDLQFGLDRRPVEYSDGLTGDEKTEKGLVTFLPSGGVEVSIDEGSAEGRIVYDLPIRVGGLIVRNLCLKVAGGRVTEFAAEGGREAFKEYLGAEGDVDRLGFFGLGLNPNLRFGFTQDDKVLGGVTLGLGDNEKKGGKNRANGREWWGAISEASLTVGGIQLMRRGKFMG
ncbi:MAG: aminopeptidase [Nitrososphaerales archaeon]|nr:aminopeptidase [Nitrososphaerales archaeon]